MDPRHIQALEQANTHRDLLSDWEQGFIDDMQERTQYAPSEKQTKIIERIEKKIKEKKPKGKPVTVYV